MKIVIQIGILYVLFQIGNWIQDFFHLMIPGSVIGMILLFFLLVFNIIKVSWIEAGAKLLIKHLTLFFIPVTVGIMEYFDLFKGKGFVLIIIVLVSTLMVMTTSGYLSQWLVLRRKEVDHD